jgi:hypothetical protein
MSFQVSLYSPGWPWTLSTPVSASSAGITGLSHYTQLVWCRSPANPRTNRWQKTFGFLSVLTREVTFSPFLAIPLTAHPFRGCSPWAVWLNGLFSSCSYTSPEIHGRWQFCFVTLGCVIVGKQYSISALQSLCPQLWLSVQIERIPWMWSANQSSK